MIPAITKYRTGRGGRGGLGLRGRPLRVDFAEGWVRRALETQLLAVLAVALVPPHIVALAARRVVFVLGLPSRAAVPLAKATRVVGVPVAIDGGFVQIGGKVHSLEKKLVAIDVGFVQEGKKKVLSP